MTSSSGRSEDDREETASLCPVIREFLPLMALQELRPGRARAVHLHLMKCKACRAKLAQYEAVTRLLRARWKGETHATTQTSERKPVVRPYHTSVAPRRIRGRKGSALSASTGASTAQVSGAPDVRHSGGALVFARRRAKAFRAAFREALPGGRSVSPLPVSSEHMERVLLDSHLSDKSSYNRRTIATPSEAIAIDVERCLARIAQQWCNTATQPPNEEFRPC